MSKKRSKIFAIAIVGFLITLCLAELQPYGSKAVATHNGGFGTFDMKEYDGNVVESVLSITDSGGWDAYTKYYICDFAFIIFFGMLQCVISYNLYVNGRRYLMHIALGIPVLRGCLDIIENIILIYIINDYPKLHTELANFSYIITTVKFATVPVWVVILFLGIVINRKQNKKIKE